MTRVDGDYNMQCDAVLPLATYDPLHTSPQSPHLDNKQLIRQPLLHLTFHDIQSCLGKDSLIGLRRPRDTLILVVPPHVFTAILILSTHILLDDNVPVLYEGLFRAVQERLEVRIREMLEHPLTPDDVVCEGLRSRRSVDTGGNRLSLSVVAGLFFR